MPFIETTDGQTIFYNDWGQGKPVVLVHGWPLSSDMWEYQIPQLVSRGLRCIVYDRRGFGRSSQPWSGYDYDTLTADLTALLDKLDLHEATLIGFSMGGGEVVRYLAKHGTRRIARAILVSAVTPYLLKHDDYSFGVERGVFDDMVDALKTDRPHFLTGFAKKFFGTGMLNFTVSSEMLDWAKGLALLASAKATIDCVRSFSETDFRADLETIKCPLLIIHGDADATVPMKASSSETARIVPSAKFNVYEREPHGLFLTAKDRLNSDIEKFILGESF
jgi:non-heme chloroperoxidase